MVGDDLVVFDRAVDGDAGQPIGEPLVSSARMPLAIAP